METIESLRRRDHELIPDGYRNGIWQQREEERAAFRLGLDEAERALRSSSEVERIMEIIIRRTHIHPDGPVASSIRHDLTLT